MAKLRHDVVYSSYVARSLTYYVSEAVVTAGAALNEFATRTSRPTRRLFRFCMRPTSVERHDVRAGQSSDGSHLPSVRGSGQVGRNLGESRGSGGSSSSGVAGG